MKNILVPVGSSKNAESLLQYAVDFAAVVGANVFVVQVYNVYTKAGTMIKIDHILQREGKAFLDRLVANIDTKNVNVQTRVLKGKLIDTLELAFNTDEIDLLILEPRTTSENEDVYFGKTSGKIIKQTKIPALIVPEGYVFKPIKTILFALKSAVLKREDALAPLKYIKSAFNANLKMLLVKTPYYNDGDFDVKEELSSEVDELIKTESETTFKGVKEHWESTSPDLLAVVRRKRGFFQKKWEKTTILKKDFQSDVPVLVLQGLK